MKPSQPPELAVWMLKHLVLGDRNEALEGDLLEEFQRRRSVGWYWRQVLGTIVLGFSNRLQARWMMVWTVVFTAAWVYGSYASVLTPPYSPPGTIFADWAHGPNQHGLWAVWSLCYVAGPLAVYLAVARNLNVRRFLVGLGTGALVILALPFLQPHLNTPFNVFLEHVRENHGNVMRWLRWYDVLQRCVPLLAAMWAAGSSRSQPRALSILGRLSRSFARYRM